MNTSHLDARTSTLVELSALAASPRTHDEFVQKLHEAVREAAVTREEIYECFLQLYLFAGFPAALEAVRALSRAWPVDTSEHPRRAGEEALGSQDHLARGTELYARVYGAKAARVREELLKLSPELSAWALVEGYGKTLSRPGLDSKTRELAIVGILSKLGWDRQLYSHMIGSRNVGATPQEIEEALKIGTMANPADFDRFLSLLMSLV